MLHSVIYNYKINKDLEKSGQGRENYGKRSMLDTL